MTWNIAFAYGLGSEGKGENGRPYQNKSKAYFENNLEQISKVIRQENPDIVFLQEVDFNASRSHYLPELDYLSRETGLLHRDSLISWDVPYVPYPGLNPKNHFGKVVSGGGILSRFPLTCIQHDLLPKPAENAKLYNYFYLFRYLQFVKVHLLKPGASQMADQEFDSIIIANLHLEAFSQTNRELHLVKMQNRLLDYFPDILAGDFNGTIPLTQETIESGWDAYPAPIPTFPSSGANQILDGFVVKRSKLSFETIRTLETGQQSDHFPVVLEATLI